MGLTTQILERLARRAANEAELFYEMLCVECDRNLVWEITFFGQSNAVIAVFVDAHDFNTEESVGEEIKRQILAQHLPRVSCSGPRL
jgi:hypothetical protein